MTNSLSVSLRWVKQEGELAKQEANQSTAPKLDLGFKEGQTIKISLGVRGGETRGGETRGGVESRQSTI